jgi:hypothetical protein
MFGRRICGRSTLLRSTRALLLIVIGQSFSICLAPDLQAQPQAANPPGLQEFAGTWAVQLEGKNILILNLKLSDGRLGGSLTLPQHIQLDPDGGISHASPELREKPVLEAVVAAETLKIKVGSASDSDDFVVRLTGHDHAQIQLKLGSEFGQPWQLVRLDGSEKSTAAAQPSSPRYSPEILALQTELEEMVKRDQAVRNEVPILASKLKEVDEGNYPELVRIHEKYKWPLISVFGKEAAHDYWVLVQHQELAFQERLLPDMRQAADSGEAFKVDYAYLYDRVMTEEGKPQHWGTQPDCKTGKAVPFPVDDPQGLLQRRTDLHMFPANEDEYMKMADSQCAKFKPGPPTTATPHP